MEKKNKRVIYTLEIVLIVIIIGLLVFILHDKILSKDDSSINNDNNVEELTDEKTIMNISLDSDIVKIAMDSFEKIVLQDDELYKEGGYDISSISNIDLLSTALANVDPKYIDYCTESSKKEAVSIDVLNDLISKYVLGKKLTIEDIKKIGNDTNELLDFEVSGNGVKITGPCGALYEYEDYQARKVVGAELDGDYLHIYEKNAFARYIKNNDDESDLPPQVNYYKEYLKVTTIEKNIQSYNYYVGDQKEPIEPNWDLYDTYKYTFKKVNDVYYFQSFGLNN